MNEKILKATAQIDNGEYENFEGTRLDIENWIENRFESDSVSIWIADDTGVIIGRKPFRQKKIAWSVHLEA